MDKNVRYVFFSIAKVQIICLTIAALFDFDGVIMDTETQYTVFWDEQGRKYLNEEDFGRRIKGQTLT